MGLTDFDPPARPAADGMGKRGAGPPPAVAPSLDGQRQTPSSKEKDEKCGILLFLGGTTTAARGRIVAKTGDLGLFFIASGVSSLGQWMRNMA